MLAWDAGDAGVTLLDTGDFYGMGRNERLVGRAILGRREKVQISVTFGAFRRPASRRSARRPSSAP